jgi:hypothetical protein
MEGTFILIPTQPWYNTPKKTIARKKTFALCLLGGSYAPVNTVGESYKGRLPPQKRLTD